MLTEIRLLKDLIGEITKRNSKRLSDEAFASELLEPLTTECQRLKAAIYELYKKAPDKQTAAWDLNNYHAALVAIANKITRQLPEEELTIMSKSAATGDDNNPLLYCVYCLADLLNCNEMCYRGILDFKQPVPHLFVLRMNELLTAQLPAIKEGLKKKDVAAWIIREIESGLNSVVRRTFPALNYHDYSYFQTFVPELSRFAADTRHKDWTKRTLLFMLKFNFNHIGLFNRWSDDIRRSLSARGNRKHQIHFLDRETELLNHTRPFPNLAYNWFSPSLKEHFLSFLVLRKQAAINEIEAAKKDDVVHLRMRQSVDWLSVDFNYRYKLNLFDYRTKEEAAAVYAVVHSTPHTSQISAHSIQKSDKTRLIGSAVEYRRMLQKIIEMIGKDFGFS
ncbi:hypothetical protein F1649_12775 [Arcticibacter tournemirensis]|uniref:Uncharacterized protein n=1 Tax=Arcticibacter tournemirensis TaxID=699437 RepID=A0A5M9H5T6_9SPHI|nr:hypothetical protein [Arcticibacter tournemirensis]KAA8482010.1 hypothetical protein F1649_12775 [Arcticibacter tournemirensis]